MAALPGRAILPVTRALFLLGISYRSRRLTLTGRYREGERVAERLLMELRQLRERHGCHKLSADVPAIDINWIGRGLAAQSTGPAEVRE